ncbi:MAG: prealbumin-like fold domain-containing protein [Chloroflexota bacterium]|nr:prealbumin-like fold domain-containing protein [Chloroflexota bacterium]
MTRDRIARDALLSYPDGVSVAMERRPVHILRPTLFVSIAGAETLFRWPTIRSTRRKRMSRRRLLLCLRLLALALLLAGAGPLGVLTAPAILDEEGKDESGKGSDDGDKGDKDEERGSEGQVERAAAYHVDADCAYEETADETTCTFAGWAPPEAKAVSHVDLPASEVCTEVLGGDHEYVDPDPNTRVVGYKSRGSNGTFTLVMTGRVTTGGTATYWFKTGDGVFPATGPGLRCGEFATQQAVEITPETEVTGQDVISPEAESPGAAEIQITLEVELVGTVEAEAATSGAILVQTYACGAVPADPSAFDWYGACQPGGDGVPFTLRSKEGTQFSDAGDGATDAAGLLRFDALAPGTYRLRGVDVVWCHAESDNVDEQGDLVVEAGQPVTVWIFLCGEETAK